MKRKSVRIIDLVNFNSCHRAPGYSLIYTHSFLRAKKWKIFTLPIRYESGLCLTGLEASLAESSGIYSAEALERMSITIQGCALV